MRCIVLLLVMGSLAATAQTENIRVGFRLNGGIGISNKLGVMFGAPFALSGDLSVMLNNRWRIAPEFGFADFRDVKNPDNKIGLIWASYSRYGHGYYGLLLGYSLLSKNLPQKLFLSGGADYLLVIDPNVQRSQGFLGGKYFSYLYSRYLNVPIQVDYSVLPVKGRQVRLVFTGRWNINEYHSFPMISVGVDMPIYPLPDSYRSPQKIR